MNTALCSSSKHNLHTQVSLRKPLRCGFTIVLCSCLLFGATHCRAQETQDVAKAARQERARRAQAKGSKHVYTDDDFARAKILTPEDEERFAAEKEPINANTPAEQAQPSLDAGINLPQLPLGDIARRYREAKLAMQAPSAFHLPFDEPTFASPIAPLSEPAPPRSSFSPTHPSLPAVQPRAVVAPAMPGPAPLHRVDPFARRSAPAAPSVANIPPAAPAAHASFSHLAPAPAVRQPNLSADIASPKLASPKFAVPAAPSAHPSAPRVASAPEVREPNLCTKIRVPKLASREFESPNPALAPAPAAPAAVASEIAPVISVERTSSSVHTVTVQPGDSLWKLAQQNLGRGSRWQELLAANPGIVDPTRLAAGTQIVVPPQTSTLKTVKSEAKIAVQKGDTLSAIARANYGRAAAWRCIAQANPEIADANRIYEGEQLLLPFECKQ
jgi:nucleoid-associated protein YgaU